MTVLISDDPRVEAVLQILDELPIHAAQHDVDAAAIRIVETLASQLQAREESDTP